MNHAFEKAFDSVRKSIEHDQLQEHLEQLSNKKVELEITIEVINHAINEQQQLLKEEQLSKVQNVFLNFNPKKKKEYTEKIAHFTKTIEEYENEKKELLNELQQTSIEFNQLQENISLIHETILTDNLSVVDGCLVIDDLNHQEIKKVDLYTKKLSEDDFVLVHCTDYFPKDKKIITAYEGKKLLTNDMTYDGVTKECYSVSHRHTVHFTVNNRIESNGAGNWDQPNIMIIEPRKYHLQEIVDESFSDCYTQGSVELSDEAILLVKEEYFSEIPEEQLNKYKVIKYKGDATFCLQKVLTLLGYEVGNIDINSANHSHSFYYYLEEALDERDFLLSFLGRTNQFDNLTSKELMVLYEHINSFQHDFFPSDQIKQLSQKINIPEKFIKFVINAGLLSSNLVEDSFIVDAIKNQSIEPWMVNSIKQVYFRINSILWSEKQEIPISSPTLEEIATLSVKDLYEYKNHDKAKTLFSHLGKLSDNFSLTIAPTSFKATSFRFPDDISLDEFKEVEQLKISQTSTSNRSYNQDVYKAKHTSISFNTENIDVETFVKWYQDTIKYIDNKQQLYLTTLFPKEEIDNTISTEINTSQK